jgi:hypothetical protein
MAADTDAIATARIAMEITGARFRKSVLPMREVT